TPFRSRRADGVADYRRVHSHRCPWATLRRRDRHFVPFTLAGRDDAHRLRCPPGRSRRLGPTRETPFADHVARWHSRWSSTSARPDPWGLAFWGDHHDGLGTAVHQKSRGPLRLLTRSPGSVCLRVL